MGNGAFGRLKKIYTAAHEFLTEKGIERHEESGASRLYRFAHFWLLVGKSFERNKCLLRATALAYTTLLALIPLLAIGVSVTSTLLKGQGKEKTGEMIEQFIGTIAPQLELTSKTELGVKVDGRKEVAQHISEYVQNVSNKTLGLTGMLGLVVVGILLLTSIENTFNDIWGVSRGRNWLARVVQYWTAISLGPVVIVLVTLLFNGPQFQFTRDFLAAAPFVATLLFRALPFLVISLGFALFYKLVPNTSVDWSAAFYGGIVGGCLWLLNSILNALNLSKVASMSAIYGPLGIIPIFLIGLYFSWLIVLFGAQVAYAAQNRSVYLQEKKAESVHQQGREFVALRIMTLVARAFLRGEPPPNSHEIATTLAVPSRLVGRLLQCLEANKLIVSVLNDETGYAPARPLDQITAHDILQALRAGQGQELATHEDASRARVRGELDRIQAAERQAAGVTLQTLAEEKL
jgi:membrane protein